jgi:uncharacterized spore protein YtfJ
MAKATQQTSSGKPDMERLIRRISAEAGPQAVFGDPVVAGTRTVVPVARVSYGGGGGWGGPPGAEEEAGSGAGFGVTAKPVGFIEVTPDSARFHAIVNWVPLAIGGMVLCALWAIVLGMVGVCRR